MKSTRSGRLALLALAATVLAACGSRAEAPSSRPPPQVGVVVVAPEPVALTTELPGRVEASRVAEVRARASGIVLERTFQEGSQVEDGDVLFRIDPAPLAAAHASAKASLARARADLTQATLRAERYAPLVETHAISQQDFDDAVAARDRAAAEVAVATAALEAARLDLTYATVRAPIPGRIGAALVTEGALVRREEATKLATVQQIDPVHVDLVQSSSELLRLRRALESGDVEGVREGEATVTVLTEDGREHPHPGTLLFTDITVDEGTGSVTLRAVVPNPEGVLLPGMYVRARLRQATLDDALLVPQQAVVRDARGASVWVVTGEGTVDSRRVRTGAAHGDRWVIEAGLQPGEQVVVDGLQKVRPGSPVQPVPFEPLAEGGTH